jgi:hypothetical protein
VIRTSALSGTRFKEAGAAFRQSSKLLAPSAMQNKFAGMNPNCAVLNPMTHMMALFITPKSQPCQYPRPTRIVEVTVNTHET